jgi:hypothetical protein
MKKIEIRKWYLIYDNGMAEVAQMTSARAKALEKSKDVVCCRISKSCVFKISLKNLFKTP